MKRRSWPIAWSGLRFAGELVVVLDRCTDASAEIARRFTDRIVEGGWEREGDRRNTGIAACAGPWVLEIDADERVPPALAEEIGQIVARSDADIHDIPVDNYIGRRLVRWGWGASFGKSAYAGLFRKGAKSWGQRPGASQAELQRHARTGAAEPAGALCRPQYLRHAATPRPLQHGARARPAGVRRDRLLRP
ncbi:MAG: glycosyltransferase [Aliidongia sp.]